MLLESYEAERTLVANRLLATTDRAFRLLMGSLTDGGNRGHCRSRHAVDAILGPRMSRHETEQLSVLRASKGEAACGQESFVYVDDSHITSTYSRTLAPMLSRKLAGALPPGWIADNTPADTTLTLPAASTAPSPN